MKRGRPKNEERLARRREEILDTAAKIFSENGFRRTDLQIVADALKIGKGTVYRYFPTKDDLFFSAVDRGMRLLVARLKEDAEAVADPLRQVECVIRSYLKFFDSHPEFAELLIQERAEFRDRKYPTFFVHRDANIEEWREFFRDLMKTGRVRKARAEEITDVVVNVLYGTMFTNHLSGRKERFEIQARKILNVIFLGILSDAERKRFLS